MLWQWAVRRHPNKGRKWIKDKYFKTRGARNWVFTATEDRKDGKQRELVLLRESDTPIQRHVKIKAGTNPYDLQWAQYFESRWGKKMLSSSRGRRKLYRLWLKQDRFCPDCQQPIKRNRPWGVRLIVKKIDGGTNAASNLQMHHLYCQGQHHNANKFSSETGCRKSAFVEAWAVWLGATWSRISNCLAL